MDDGLRCKYPYKVCLEQRAFKRNGTLHNLCAYHRHKANSVQKKHISKRLKELVPDPIPFKYEDKVVEDDSYLASLLLSLVESPQPGCVEPIALQSAESTPAPWDIDVDTYALLINMTP